MGTIAIIGVVLAALFNLAGGIMSFASQKKTNEFNQQQYEDWKSYNTPAAQMERLAEAGLNPYMVSGVNNTLSQPFAIGQNTGLAELFSSMSKNMSGLSSTALSSERNDIAWMNADTKKTQASIQDRLAKLRERMVILAEKRNDPMMALLWGQADAQTIGNSILRRSQDDIVNLRHYQALQHEQQYNFLEKLNPMRLFYYVPYQRARINSLLSSAALARRQITHLDWLEPFQREQFLHNSKMDFKRFYQGKNQFELGLGYDYDRLGLSNNYYDLAVDKYWRDLVYGYPGWSLFKPRVSRIGKGGAGQFPTWTDYDYEW